MEFSFPSTLKILEEYLLYKFRINSWHLRVWSFAIQWFYTCEKKLPVLKKNLSQPLKSHLQSLGSLVSTCPYYWHLAVFASSPGRDYHVRDARPRVQGEAKRDQGLRPHQPSPRCQGIAPPTPAPTWSSALAA